MIKRLLVFIMLYSLTGCEGKKYEKFVDRYYDENFDEFVNYDLFVRDFDRNNDPIVGVRQLTGSDYQYCFITIERKSGKVKKTNYGLLKEKISVDTQKANHLAARFLKYDVYQLEVDSNKDVLVTLFPEAKEHLVRSSAKNTNKQCEKIRGNWYRCR